MAIPTKKEILSQILADFKAEYGSAPVRRSVEYALSRALMGQTSGLYGKANTLISTLIPDQASGNVLWRWLTIFTGEGQKAAQYWVGTMIVTGTNGTVIPNNTPLVRTDGAEYTITTGGTISGGAVEVAVQADVAGTASDLEVADTLKLSNPISGAATEVTVATVTQTGEDVESEEAGLERLLQRIQRRIRVGTEADYIEWALEVPGVTRAWAYPRVNGPNTIAIAFVRDGDGTGAAVLPDLTERNEVLEHLEESKPVEVDVSVMTLTASTVNITITNLSPNTVAVQDAIELALQDMFTQDAEPGGTLFRSRIDAAISRATGENSHNLTFPASDLTFTAGQFPVLGLVSIS